MTGGLTPTRNQFISVLITGASSGIGRALAVACAAPGVELHLAGRDRTRLEDAVTAARLRGAVVRPRLIDVCDREGMEAWIGGVGPLNLVIANAGIGGGTEGDAPESAEQVRAILEANLHGALNTVLPAIAAMQTQPAGPDGVRGRIATIASIAALIPVPGAPSYGASKAALDSWMVASAPAARQTGIRLTSICPGYIRTPMTARNRFPMPGLMEPHEAARIILRGIAAGRVRLAFPWWVASLARLADLAPAGLLVKLLARAPGKPPFGSDPPS